MWDATGDFLDALIQKYGVRRVLLAPFVAMAATSAFGLVRDSNVAAFIAALASAFVAVVLIIYFGIGWRNTRVALAERTRTLTRYVDRFARTAEPPFAFSIGDWEEQVVVGCRGDTVIERWITVVVGPQEIFSCWTSNYAFASGEMTPAQRRRVVVLARSFDSSRKLGARYDLTYEWEQNAQRILIHFDQPVSAGETVRIWVRWSWPGYYRSLLDGTAENVEWKMCRPANRINASIRFEKSAKLRDKLKITQYSPNGSYVVSRSPNTTSSPDGSVVVEAEYTQVVPGTLVAFRLDT